MPPARSRRPWLPMLRRGFAAALGMPLAPCISVGQLVFLMSCPLSFPKEAAGTKMKEGLVPWDRPSGQRAFRGPGLNPCGRVLTNTAIPNGV